MTSTRRTQLKWHKATVALFARKKQINESKTEKNGHVCFVLYGFNYYSRLITVRYFCSEKQDREKNSRRRPKEKAVSGWANNKHALNPEFFKSRAPDRGRLCIGTRRESMHALLKRTARSGKHLHRALYATDGNGLGNETLLCVCW